MMELLIKSAFNCKLRHYSEVGSTRRLDAGGQLRTAQGQSSVPTLSTARSTSSSLCLPPPTASGRGASGSRGGVGVSGGGSPLQTRPSTSSGVGAAAAGGGMLGNTSFVSAEMSAEMSHLSLHDGEHTPHPHTPGHQSSAGSSTYLTSHWSTPTSAATLERTLEGGHNLRVVSAGTQRHQQKLQLS